MLTRRSFLASTAAGLAVMPSLSSAAEATPNPAAKPLPRFGVAGYSLREFTVAETLHWLGRWGLTQWAIKDVHLPLTADASAIAALRAEAAAAGIEIYAAGVITLRNQEEIDRAFAYAQRLGVKLLTIAPTREVLPALEKAVQATDIRVAIHNHGPDQYKNMEIFATPDDAYALIKDLDARIGLCIDIGHTQRAGRDPLASFQACFDRVYDLHVKDVTSATPEGKTVPNGRGIIDLPTFVRAVQSSGYTGVWGLEYEGSKADTLPGVAESIGYVRGLLT